MQDLEVQDEDKKDDEMQGQNEKVDEVQGHNVEEKKEKEEDLT